MEMKQAIFRVERIIKTTLLFSKGVIIKPKNFYISELEKELKSIIKYYSYSKEIKFIFFMPDIEIKADFDLILLVLQNLIFNAIDAIEENSEDEGLVEIIYEKTEKYHIFHIYDSGIPFENKNILFNAFKTTKTKGNGLGLALSLQIIKAHNGDIILSNDKKGFDIQIPYNV
jgi:signal transduction histidine kinase